MTIQMIKTYGSFVVDKIKNEEKGEIGFGTIIVMCIGLILAAFVILPGLRTFGTNVLADINSWWTNDIAPELNASS